MCHGVSQNGGSPSHVKQAETHHLWIPILLGTPIYIYIDQTTVVLFSVPLRKQEPVGPLRISFARLFVETIRPVSHSLRCRCVLYMSLFGRYREPCQSGDMGTFPPKGSPRFVPRTAQAHCDPNPGCNLRPKTQGVVFSGPTGKPPRSTLSLACETPNTILGFQRR